MECPSTTEAMLLALLKNRKDKREKRSVGVQKKITKRVQRRVEVRTLAKSTTLTGAQIARRTGMPKSFVYDQIKKLRRKASVNGMPSTGRLKKVTKSVTKKILAKTKGKEKRSTRKVAKILQGEGVQVSHETVAHTSFPGADTTSQSYKAESQSRTTDKGPFSGNNISSATHVERRLPFVSLTIFAPVFASHFGGRPL